MPAVNDVGEPCAGEPHARFDGRELETERGTWPRSLGWHSRPGNRRKKGPRPYRHEKPPRQLPTLHDLVGVSAADHIAVLDAALAQLPDEYRHAIPVLVRADTAACTKDFLAHVRGLRKQGVATEFSVGWAIGERERAAIARIPHRAWTPAIDAAGQPREDPPEVLALPIEWQSTGPQRSHKREPNPDFTH